MVALIGSVLVLCLVSNPLWAQHDVGQTKVLNWLLFAYGLPALLAFVAGREVTRVTDRRIGAAGGIVSLLLLFVLVSLEVRQWFHGAVLPGGELTNAEMYAYSAAWIVFALMLLIGGIALRNEVLRWASLAVMLLSVGKVFVMDTAHLEDLYRVVSFLGLGMSLIALGYLYQRFVFRKTPQVMGPRD